MERFKAIEKEMKTKAYSREGLIMSGRMDPKEKEKAETCSWVTERVEALTIQIEALEAEVETLQAGAKKGKNNPAKERISELEDKIERHKWHQGRLELILRLLENGQIETDKVLCPSFYISCRMGVIVHVSSRYQADSFSKLLPCSPWLINPNSSSSYFA
jgi:CCR4-NOT transcription complex subunit 3